ncbi:VOC family protein [Amycolatopsis nigrescens]|uniref:VOC family protein n=1 Tax=Amycolatopsis nigrescens TaxID=381445 RepID=UPI000379605F|nr:VOC family protein [Amycolatopsis nigrescens]
MTTTDAPGQPQIWPTLRSPNLRPLIDFYVAAFGFVETAAFADADGQVLHAELVGPRGGGLILGLEDGGYVTPLPRAAMRCYVVEPDPDALFARAVAAGADVVREPYDAPHGSRDCELRDPEGNHWLFGTYAGAPLPGK